MAKEHDSASICICRMQNGLHDVLFSFEGAEIIIPPEGAKVIGARLIELAEKCIELDDGAERNDSVREFDDLSPQN